jgi:hypothetical protein
VQWIRGLEIKELVDSRYPPRDHVRGKVRGHKLCGDRVDE